MSRFHQCRRGEHQAGGDALPFALPGSRATFTPDRDVNVRHLRIEVALDFATASVDGVCTLTLVPLGAARARVALDAVEMQIHAVTLSDGAALEYAYDGQKLSFDLGARKEGEAVDVVVRYRCTPRRGLYFIRPDAGYPKRPLQAWSQGQDEDNRAWFPCFDHPAVKSTSEVIATVPKQMTILSNGSIVEDRVSGESRTVHFRQEVPHSSYLVTLVAGEYTHLEDKAGAVELHYLVNPGREEDAPRTFGNTAKMIELFAERTGRAYPWPRYSQITVAEFIFGGMENTSATTLTDQTLHDARAHLDFSSEPLISHELAHQWFGDLLTCRDWSQGWLNEGFATYMELVWKEHIAGRDDADYDRLGDIEAYLDEDSHRYRRPIVTNVYHEPIDVFDRHLYEKGGCVLHMLRTELGDARFWKAIQHYVKKHAGGSVETRDLARAVDEATGWNPDRFFEQWVFSAGFPELKLEASYDEETKLARITVAQTQKVEGQTPLFSFPLPVRFVVDGAGHDVTLTVSQAAETFVVPLGGKPSQVIPDPGYNILKTLDEKKGDELWTAQLAGAERAIDRLRAARALGKAGNPMMLDALVKSMRDDPHWSVRGEAGLALGALKTTAARDAIAAAVATEGHPKARRHLVKALGAFRGDERAADAIETTLARDPSYFVEAESAMSLAKTRSPRAFDKLMQAMTRPSYLDVIASMCLSGMAELRDERGIDLALEAAKYGKPVVGRRAAIGVLGALGAEFPQQKRRVRETLVELLDDPDFRARIAVVEALRVLGDTEAVDALHRAMGRDLDGRVRRRAREVARKLTEGSPNDEQVRSLRDAVEKLQDENRELKERVMKLETRK
ncbi:MAG: Peptidase rane alanine aminopeptidase [Myxococcales bacterium]|nr:Peptidase rane alanine aminopeptidase [Myxococcales bacterium]